MTDTAINISGVSKKYRLGMIGGTTLKAELQIKMAKLKKRGNPYDPIGYEGVAEAQAGKEFLALDNVSFQVKKGERLGILGRNGAGKSTLLKLLSRITAPSKGEIELAGRVASMLEVGTGFHGELSGRENIYLNGAILGMTKAEIDGKIEEIIDFSECRRFIDTPVKRYSSGMYVKLAFSVAAHLDSEILLMDEVLAVGDMAFQRKCLDKMNEISRDEGRTILYVSHNMGTIRQLCERCVVLDHGRLIYDGEVEESIALYAGRVGDLRTARVYEPEDHDATGSQEMLLVGMEVLGREEALYKRGDALDGILRCTVREDVSDVLLRFEMRAGDQVVGTALSELSYSGSGGVDVVFRLSFSTKEYAPGRYTADAYLYKINGYRQHILIDKVVSALVFEVYDDGISMSKWLPRTWGYVRLEDVQVSW